MLLEDLSSGNEFIARHIGFDQTARKEALKELGYSNLDDFIKEVIPQNLISEVNLENGISEKDALDLLKSFADKNIINRNYIGLGYYPTLMPYVIQRNLLENPGWYTAYTPYQAEIAQGRLESLLNFQQVCIDLTGLSMANASLLDEATATCEAMSISHRLSKSKSNKVFIDDRIFPQTLDVIKTRAKYFDFELVIGNIDSIPDDDFFSAILQYTGKDGDLKDLTPIITEFKEKEAIVTVISDIMSLVLLKSPGAMGADIAVGSTQRFGVPMSFGGPHAAYFAFRDKYKRSAPGRIIGISKDSYGKPAYRMILQTREQHIRREKATSNICTSQALLANIAAMYAVYHGSQGLKKIATRIHAYASIFVDEINNSNFKIKYNSFFDTVIVDCLDKQEEIYKKALDLGINLRKIDATFLALSFHELTNDQDLQDLIKVFLDKEIKTSLEYTTKIPPELLRDDEILNHEVFNNYHTEHEMLRYLKKLENKDISLTQSMIPLGSCTMKLNASSEMIPISWPAFTDIHPATPKNQVQGYLDLLNDLEYKLKAITGFNKINFQPNSGAQGEYAGLVTIRRYLEALGENQRNICLIPESAHGTNPASAKMAGLEIVTVKTDKAGNVDIEDLKNKAEKNKEYLAVFMITYPSTHGVYEEGIRLIADIIHQNGGQVYMDGANMNAQVCIMKPANLGADVLHMNLHKTFAIPHGGGGPGMGPIGLKSHLAKYTPKHVFIDQDLNNYNAVSAAPFGSAGILSITWMYITLMGKSGLELATSCALLNANYIAQKLSSDYHILYSGINGKVAHECIIDIREIKNKIGISEIDIAKRLADYGFHAPTVSFPVAGTLMIEPTESESKKELDKFILAMKTIKQEILKVKDNIWSKDNNPLVNAPHTIADLINWDKPYTIEEAIYPLDYIKENKYWAPVNRIDEVYGDRHLIWYL